MVSGEVKVIVLPETEAISLISFIGRSVLENHDMAAGGVPGVELYGPDAFELPLSSPGETGKCMFQATRSPAHTLDCPGKPVGVDCQDAPDSHPRERIAPRQSLTHWQS